MDSKTVRKAALRGLRFWRKKEKRKRRGFLKVYKEFYFKKQWPFIGRKQRFTTIPEMMEWIKLNGDIFDLFDLYPYSSQMGDLERINTLCKHADTITLDSHDVFRLEDFMDKKCE